ncbi:receptor-transporting protein 2-like [Varanus komodoensis]|uniref:receptor-transporting protein 2-like n=1 Tax=Varanus komodoensis TaxID=61221 RepID=UPI001CF77360|nr:receptor-transporting protein 2-like [Varanus komodoensis]
MMECQKLPDEWDLTEDPEMETCLKGWRQYVQNHLFGSFECSKCSHTWKSAKVTVIFHMQLLRTALGPARGKVKMRVFGQKCRRCRSGKFEEPKFSDKTAECCLHNLVQKILEKCYERGRKAHALLQPEPEDGNCWGPHDRNGCEACACGLCFEPSRPASQGPWEGISLQSSPLAWRHELKRRAGDASAPCVWLLVVAAAVLILLASSLQKQESLKGKLQLVTATGTWRVIPKDPSPVPNLCAWGLVLLLTSEPEISCSDLLLKLLGSAKATLQSMS